MKKYTKTKKYTIHTALELLESIQTLQSNRDDDEGDDEKEEGDQDCDCDPADGPCQCDDDEVDDTALGNTQQGQDASPTLSSLGMRQSTGPTDQWSQAQQILQLTRQIATRYDPRRNPIRPTEHVGRGFGTPI